MTTQLKHDLSVAIFSVLIGSLLGAVGTAYYNQVTATAEIAGVKHELKAIKEALPTKANLQVVNSEIESIKKEAERLSNSIEAFDAIADLHEKRIDKNEFKILQLESN